MLIIDYLDAAADFFRRFSCYADFASFMPPADGFRRLALMLRERASRLPTPPRATILLIAITRCHTSAYAP